MTDEELIAAMQRVADARRDPAGPPGDVIWDRVEARRAHAAHPWMSPRLVAVLVATAASLAIVATGIRMHRRAATPPAETALASASAVVVRRHLAQSDTMIEAFHAALASGRWDDRLTSQARDLDLATRRLQNGRLNADSTLAGLLTDLDLVLTEIVAYGDAAGDRGTEADMIDYSLRVRQVVPRIRAAWTDAGARAAAQGLDP